MGRVRRTVNFDNPTARQGLAVCFSGENVEGLRAILIQLLVHEQAPPIFLSPTTGYYDYYFRMKRIRVEIILETPPTATSKIRVTNVSEVSVCTSATSNHPDDL